MIRFENIDIKFNKKIIFNKFSLNINDGEKVVITGDSGVGKTTLFNLLLGFKKPDTGVVYVADLSVKPQNINKIRKLISYVPQNVNMAFDTALDMFNAQFLYSKISLPDEKKVKDVFTDFNLDYSVLSQQVSSLSGGEKQRILLISSILTGKQLLLLDEPTSALDHKNKEILVKYIKNMPETTVLSISHDDFWIDNMQRVVKL